VEAGIDIRPLGRDDHSAFARFFDGLSARSRYLRFVAPMPRLPKRTLDWLVEVDGHRHRAIAAWRGDELVGEARYVAFGDESAEVGLAVRDDWQRRGVGTGMLLRLIAEAGDNGFCHLTASSLQENVAVRRLLSATGFVATGTADGTSEWERDTCTCPHRQLTSTHAR
jgi:GNAT superfamily N-acetyltransferase